MQGAIYGIYRVSEDKLVESLTTDEKGYAISSELPFGEYYLKEILPPIHFHLDKNVYSFNVYEQQELIRLDVKNEPRIGKLIAYYTGEPITEGIDGSDMLTPIETGDNITVLLVVLVLACLSGCAILVLVIKRKKK